MRELDPRKFIPHGEPILMLDGVREIDPGRRAVGTKRLPSGCPLFEGHMPGDPLLPGVYLIEGIAQTGAVMLLAARDGEGSEGKGSGRLAFVRDFKFRSPVLPDETLSMDVTFVEASPPFYTIGGKVSVEGRRVAEGSVVITLPPLDATGKRELL